MIADFHFLRPAWLVLLPVTGWLWWIVTRHDDPLRGWREVMAPELLTALTIGDRRQSRLRQFGLLAMWSLALLALAGPSWRPEPNPFGDDPLPLVVLLSATESMQTEDLVPSRMERARLKVAALAELRPAQPLGLIAFAGSSHLVMPPTRDTAIVAQMAMEIGPAIMPKPGDDLTAAIHRAEKLLEPRGGTILAMVDHVETDVVRDWDLPLHLLAVGTDDSPETASVAAAGKRLRARVTQLTSDDSDLESICRAVARRPMAVAAESGEVRWADDGWWLILPLAALVLATFRRERSPEERVDGP